MDDILLKISEKILDQIRTEKAISSPDENIGYTEFIIDGNEYSKWILRNIKESSSYIKRDITNAAIGTEYIGSNTLYNKNYISRDSIAGGAIITGGIGKHQYEGRIKTLKVDVNLLGTYTNSDKYGGDAQNGNIKFKDDDIDFSFSSLLYEIEQIKKLEFENQRIRQELKGKEEDTELAKALVKEIDDNEKEISELKRKVRKHIAQEVALRDQPILDKYQEKVKRSKILDGTLIINGGPGTGKTTALIQRINFLTAPTIVEETGEISEEKARILFDQKTSWIFYSPSELLSSYLSDAMIAEGLDADNERVRTWDSHRKSILRSTGLINPETKRPFLTKNNKDGKLFFKQSVENYKLIDDLFTQELLDKQLDKIRKIHNRDEIKKIDEKLETQSAENHRKILKQTSIKIQDASKRALKFKQFADWIQFFISIQKEFSEYFKGLNKEIQEDIKLESARLQLQVDTDVELSEWLKSIIIEEIRSLSDQDIEEEEEELEEEEESINIEETIDLKTAINRKLRSLLRSISIREIDATNNKLSPKNKILLDKIGHLINRENLSSIGIRLYFKKYFEKPTKGLEANLLAEIPMRYKQFRRMILKGSSDCLTPGGIEDCDKALKNNNKFLNNEEADYLLSLIFRICKTLFKTNRNYFNDSEHPYLISFKKNIKGVIAIDEATDFSLWELSAMSHLAHPFFESVTLSGDLMQRLTKRGISSWSDYTTIFPNSEIKDLKIAYRQTAKLLEIAAEIYRWNVNAPAEFIPYNPPDPFDPDPLIFKGENEEEKLNWLVERIIEIQHLYGSSFPTLAIFVKDDLEVLRIANLLNEYDQLEEVGLEVAPCVQGQILGDKQKIRVYSIEFIKGLEFGAVFFLDIDNLSGKSEDLINKYLYVGLSRANLFLGVTIENDFPEDLEYLSTKFKQGDWKDFKSN
jgi:hypothetical protein